MTTCGYAQVSMGGLPRKFSTTVANGNPLAKALTALGVEDTGAPRKMATAANLCESDV